MVDTTTTTGGAGGDRQRASAAFQRHAFAALLAGETPRLEEITEVASRDTLGVAHAVAWLEDHGELERDGELLVGAHGLTRRTTPHALSIGERTLHTWCAYDAVAIPVALGATARATTTCPACQQPVVVEIYAGRLPDADTPVLWMPIGPCERIIDDFCPLRQPVLQPRPRRRLATRDGRPDRPSRHTRRDPGAGPDRVGRHRHPPLTAAGDMFDPEAIDPGGPVDPVVAGPQPVDEVTRPAAFTLIAPSWYPPEHATTQAYGFCFTPDGRVVLVQAHDGFFNLPGGQLEPGETAADALGREVAEEASARVTACHYLACQHVWDPQAPAGPTSHYQTRWWARVELEPWNPSDDEYVARRLVAPSDVLPTLSWQRKEIAGRLLNLALATERAYRHGDPGGGSAPSAPSASG